MSETNPASALDVSSNGSSSVVVPQFALGALVATPGALALLQAHGVDPASLITRHVQGDWGCLCAEDVQANADALKFGDRLLSVYLLPPLSSSLSPPVTSPGAGENVENGVEAMRVWILTEADRSVTTILRPEDY